MYLAITIIISALLIITLGGGGRSSPGYCVFTSEGAAVQSVVPIKNSILGDIGRHRKSGGGGSRVWLGTCIAVYIGAPKSPASQ